MDPGSTVTLLAVGASIALSPRQALRTSGPAAAAVALVALFVTLSVGVAGATSGRTLQELAREDGWLEWLTVTALLVASWRWVRAALQASGRARLVAAMLALFAFLVAGEEMSWGQRLLAIRPPEYLLEHNFQQELNAHNLLQGDAPVRITGKQLALGLAGALAAWTLAGAFLRRRKPAHAFGALAPPSWVLPWLAGAAWLEVVYPLELSGELAECLLAFVLAAASWSWLPAPTPRAALVAASASVAAAALCVALVDSLRQDDARIAAARLELAELAGALDPAVLPKLRERPRVHKRLYTAIRQQYLELERSENRYFIDPWGNAYWLSWDREQRTARIYSFGPNGRRDEGGDDLAVERILMPQ